MDAKGTKVTLESFSEWKRKYAEETGKTKAEKLAGLNKKPTGRQLFERDASLAKSDLDFVSKDEEAVCVDESLFQDLDELDLDDSEYEPDDSDLSDSD